MAPPADAPADERLRKNLWKKGGENAKICIFAPKFGLKCPAKTLSGNLMP
jgi:hypothetical protein